MGRKPRSDLFECVWQVPYAPGELKAIAYRGGKAVAETTQRTAGIPAKLQLTTDNAALNADHNDLALVTMAILDEHGVLVPDAANRIGLRLLGPAQYLGSENGDPVDITPQRKAWRKTFAGLARAFYAGKDEDHGAVEVAALGVLGPLYFNTTTTVTIAFERVALRGALSPQPFEIYYTTDGSDPTPTSMRYRTPLKLERTTAIRAAAYREGKLMAGSSGVFTKGQRPVSVESAGAHEDQGAAEDPSHKKGKAKKKKF